MPATYQTTVFILTCAKFIPCTLAMPMHVVNTYEHCYSNAFLALVCVLTNQSVYYDMNWEYTNNNNTSLFHYVDDWNLKLLNIAYIICNNKASISL